MPRHTTRRLAAVLGLGITVALATTTLTTLTPPAQAADNGYTYAGEFATFTGVQDPSVMAVAPDGRIFVAGTNPGQDPGSKVRVFDGAGTQVGAWDTPINNLGGMTIDGAGNVYLGDYSGSIIDDVPASVRVYSASGTYLRNFTRNDEEYPAIGDVTLDAAGNAYTVDPVDSLVSRYAPDGTYLGSWGTEGSGPGQFDGPFGVTVSPDGTLYVADTDNDRVQFFVAATGQLLGQWGQSGTGNGQLSFPSEITVAPNGHVLVADSTSRVQEFTATGQFVRVAAQTQLGLNFDLDFGPGDTLYVAGRLGSLQRGVARFTPTITPSTPSAGGATVTKKKVKTKKGKATVAITCAASTVCSGKVTLKQKKTTLGKKKYAVAAGATTKVKIRLTGKAKALLRRNKQIKATVTLKPAIGAKTVTKVKLRR